MFESRWPPPVSLTKPHAGQYETYASCVLTPKESVVVQYQNKRSWPFGFRKQIISGRAARGQTAMFVHDLLFGTLG